MKIGASLAALVVPTVTVCAPQIGAHSAAATNPINIA
jgi:hypothetical protein